MSVLPRSTQSTVRRHREPGLPGRGWHRAAERLRRTADEGELALDGLGSVRQHDDECAEQLGTSDHRGEARQVSAYEQIGAQGRRRLAVLVVLALALCLAAGLTLGASADAKKKHKKQHRTFAAQISPNAGIPEYPGTGHATPVLSTITVGKKFKGKTVADVNLTGLQTTGSGTGAADDLFFKLTAPNGRTVQLIGSFFPGNGIGDQNIGPLTIDDDSPVAICDSDTLSCRDPSQR